MKYPRIFRARFDDKLMDDIRQASLDTKVSQQEIVRQGARMWLDEVDRVQGVDGRIGHRLVEPVVEVAKRPAQPRKQPPPSSDPLAALRRHERKHYSSGR